MTTVNVAVSKTINAPAATIYAILADYRTHHPHILPKAYFTGLEVEEGGFGEGTVFRSGLKIMGREQRFRMRVTEPEPGRVLAETDVATGLVTKFIVEDQGERQADVTFETTIQPQPGLQGWLERLFVPGFLRRVYRVELQQLDDYVQSQQG